MPLGSRASTALRSILSIALGGVGAAIIICEGIATRLRRMRTESCMIVEYLVEYWFPFVFDKRNLLKEIVGNQGIIHILLTTKMTNRSEKQGFSTKQLDIKLASTSLLILCIHFLQGCNAVYTVSRGNIIARQG